MPVATPLMKVTIAPSADPRLAALFAALENNIKVEVPDGFLLGKISDTLPSVNEGPVLKDKTWFVWDEAIGAYVSQDGGIAIGSINWFAYNTIDTDKWHVCDGSALTRGEPFDQLFAKIGTRFGTGDGSTTFNIPDLRGRVAVGAGVGNVPGAPGQPAKALTPRSLSDVFGEEGHVLTVAELPALTLNGNVGPTGGANATGFGAVGLAHPNMQPSVGLYAAIRYA